MADKEFKTYKEQIFLLKKKKLIIEDEQHAIELLKRTSYFALINGYKKHFKSDNGNYKDGTKIEDIEELFVFDEKLRNFLLKYLLIIERNVKSSISYNFSDKFRNARDYLNTINYDYSTPDNIKGINKLVSILTSICESEDHPYINHYKNNHDGNIPLWVLVNAMTFGQVSKMYKVLKMSIQQKIASDLEIDSNKELAKMLNLLTLFRNVCAHNERLYDFCVIDTDIGKKYIQDVIDIDTSDKKVENQARRLFGALVCCKKLLPKESSEDIFIELKSIIDTSFKDEHMRTIITLDMGLPENWFSLIKRTDKENEEPDRNTETMDTLLDDNNCETADNESGLNESAVKDTENYEDDKELVAI